MEKYNHDIIWNYKPSKDTYTKAMALILKLSKTNINLMDLFESEERPSRIFAFVESKYSARIEGIYTGLFNMVNTGGTTEEQKSLKPLIQLLLSSRELDYKTIIELSDIMNVTKDSNKRFEPVFGVYKGKEKIYEPPLDKEVVTSLLKQIIDKTEKDMDIIQIIHSHIIFEKIHPFVDSNGRIGRLIFQKAVTKMLGFSKALPISNFIFRNKQLYYESLDITDNESIDKGVRNIIMMLAEMSDRINAFTLEVSQWLIKQEKHIMSISNKVTNDMALDILLALQTKRKDIEDKYGLNIRTIDSIFTKLNEKIPFNFKKANRYSLYWNIELEEIVDKYFGG